MNDEILKLDNQVCFRLYSISRKMTKVYEPLLSKYNLTYPQYIVMLGIFEYKIIDFKDLSKLVNLKPGTLTPILTKLEEIGYVIREHPKDDKRKINIMLSEEGKRLNQKIVDVPIGLAESLQLTIQKYTTLVTELDDLNIRLNKILKDNNQN
jgi:DNA-binding MarR family transcriptional regulator